MFSDRLCIASEGEININMSAENLLSCCAYCGQGCDGGYPDMAWKYIQSHGIVTGGDYGSHEVRTLSIKDDILSFVA